MRFLCDENITQDAVKLLIKAGHDVETFQSMNLRGISNSDLMKKVIEFNRILITFDVDFTHPPVRIFPGILLIRIQPNTDKYVLPVLEKLLKKTDTIDFTNKVSFLEELAIISQSDDLSQF
jgi:predicted nuclease of predicted toxin-antitoxin system